MQVRGYVVVDGHVRDVLGFDYLREVLRGFRLRLVLRDDRDRSRWKLHGHMTFHGYAPGSLDRDVRVRAR